MKRYLWSFMGPNAPVSLKITHSEKIYVALFLQLQTCAQHARLHRVHQKHRQPYRFHQPIRYYHRRLSQLHTSRAPFKIWSKSIHVGKILGNYRNYKNTIGSNAKPKKVHQAPFSIFNIGICVSA
ncbi:hypothetical protein [Galbibacter sp. PAP.153]|uniref:hypothetical protein n=1 Tax=Galbibacter sp. PAP.153 TaxID=3104623 RepID=UPI00300AA96A